MSLISTAAKVKHPKIPVQELSPEEVSDKTLENLARRGWCLWKCSELNGDVILIVEPDVAENIPAVYPRYTVDELRQLAENELPAIILIHEAKKLCGAEVVTSG